MSKIALYHCDTMEKIPLIVEQIINSLGREKISALFKNKRVLIKPNLCIDLQSEKGATTHPALIDAVIAAAKDFGAKVIVGDGPIVGVKGKIFEITGAADVCKRHNVPLINLNTEKGRVIRLENALAFNEALIANTYFEVDTIVNLPIFKSNAIYWLSGALKNMKGFLVGKEKHRPHRIDVPKCVADLNRMLKQDLIIMDGYIGMMGDGPAAGEAANAKLLIGGYDPVAVDSVAATLMGFPLNKIPMIKYAEKSGVGSTEFDITGDLISTFKFKFKKPMIARANSIAGIIGWVLKILIPLASSRSRIVIDSKKCNLCGRCKTACQFGAVSIRNKSVEIDKNKCVFCLCCHEACSMNAMSPKGLLTRTDAFMKGANK